MKRNLLKIDKNEKNSLLEMHRKRGYKTIVEEEDDLLGLLDKKEDGIEDLGFEDDENEFDSENDSHSHEIESDNTGGDEDFSKKRSDFFGSLSADDISDDFDQDFDSENDIEISDEEFMEIYNTEMKEGNTKEKEKEKTKEKEKDKKKRNPFKDPNPGTEEDPRGEKKDKKNKKLKEGKKVVRLTENELVNLIKKMINE